MNTDSCTWIMPTSPRSSVIVSIVVLDSSLLFDDVLLLFCICCFSGVPAWRLMSEYSITRWVSPRRYTVDPMLSALGNPFKCHEEVLYLQPLIPLKRFVFFPPTGGGSEGKV